MVKEEEVEVVDMENKEDIKKVLFYLYWIHCIYINVEPERKMKKD
jgi:hypothetical protein